MTECQHLDEERREATGPVRDEVGQMRQLLKVERVGFLSTISVLAIVFLIASLAVNLWQWRQPPRIYAFRVDEIRAQVLDYNANNYTPREGEIKSYLERWATDRFRLVSAVIPYTFKENYFFLADSIARPLAVSDADVVAKIQSAAVGEQDILIHGVSFRGLDTKRMSDGTLASGECVIDMDKLYNITGPDSKEHWNITVKYLVNPTISSKMTPAFQSANPIGLQIVWFHEDRIQ